MTMPQMTGTELAGRLLAIRPGLPIILCTGFSESLNEEKVRGLGIRGFFTKPFTARDFSRHVRRVLDGNPAANLK